MSENKDQVASLYSGKWEGRFVGYLSNKYGRNTDLHELMEDARQIVAHGLHQQKSKGKGPFSDAYIFTSYKHAVVTVVRQQSGRLRPRKWLLAFGTVGEWLYTLYCIEKMSRSEILEKNYKDFLLDTDQILEIINEMDAKQECVDRTQISLIDDKGQNIEVAVGSTPEEELILAQSLSLQALLFNHGGLNLSLAKKFLGRLGEIDKQVIDALQLDDDERFILLSTIQEFTDERIGELLGFSVRQIRYRRQIALEKLADLLVRIGVELKDLLGN